MGGCMVDTRGGDMAGKLNVDRPISAEIDGGKHVGGRWTVGQGYGCHGLTLAQLCGKTTIGSTAPDRTVYVHIATHPRMNVNARWGSGFEIVSEPRVEC